MFNCQLKLINGMKFLNINSGWMPNNGDKYFLLERSHGFNNQFNSIVDFFYSCGLFPYQWKSHLRLNLLKLRILT